MRKILDMNSTDPLKLLPMKYRWAYEHYKTGASNNWVPEEVPMMSDCELWKSNKLTEEERNVILHNLGFFATAEGLTANNLVLTLYKFINNPECRLYMLRQALEEAVHSDTFVYIIDSLNLNSDEVYEMYQKIPSIKEKDDFVIQLIKNILDKDFDPTKDPNSLIQDLIGFYVILEGIMFYSGFAMMLALKRQNKMVGIGEQFDFIRRDECLDSHTEVLTRFGWKKVSKIDMDTEIVQWHPGETLSFTKPTRISKNYVETALLYSAGATPIKLVSPNHRLLLNGPAGPECLLAKDVSEFVSDQLVQCGILSNESAKRQFDSRDKFFINVLAHSMFGKFSGNILTLTGESKNLNHLKPLLDELKISYVFKQILGYDAYEIEYQHKSEIPSIENFDYKSVNTTWAKDCLSYIKSLNLPDYTYTYNTYGKKLREFMTILETFTNQIDDVFINDNCFDYQVKIKRMELKEYKKEMIGIEVPSGYIVTRFNGTVAVTGNSVHVSFGVHLIQQILQEYPNIWTDQLKNKIVENIKRAVELEEKYIDDICPIAFAGIPNQQYKKYVQYIADFRLDRLGLPLVYHVENPFEWMSKMNDLDKEKNFFETKVTEYNKGMLDWDED